MGRKIIKCIKVVYMLFKFLFWKLTLCCLFTLVNLAAFNEKNKLLKFKDSGKCIFICSSCASVAVQPSFLFMLHSTAM